MMLTSMVRCLSSEVYFLTSVLFVYHTLLMLSTVYIPSEWVSIGTKKPTYSLKYVGLFDYSISKWE